MNCFPGLFSVSDGTYLVFGMALLISFHVCAYSWMLVCLICLPGLCSIPVLAWFGAHCPALLPHSVEDSSVLHDAEQLVGGGHVVRDRPLAIPEKGVWRPDLADHQVVEPQDLDGALKFQPLVYPCLTKEHVHGVFLDVGLEYGLRIYLLLLQPALLLVLLLLMLLLSPLPPERMADGFVSHGFIGTCWIEYWQCDEIFFSSQFWTIPLVLSVLMKSKNLFFFFF